MISFIHKEKGYKISTFLGYWGMISPCNVLLPRQVILSGVCWPLPIHVWKYTWQVSSGLLIFLKITSAGNITTCPIACDFGKKVTGQVEVLAGQVNLKGSLPRSANNVLQPMLHPELWNKAYIHKIFDDELNSFKYFFNYCFFREVSPK